MKRVLAIDANRVFLFSVVVSQILMYCISGLGVQDIMLLQFLVEALMVLPAVFYLMSRQQSVKRSFGLVVPGWKEWLLLIPLAVCVDKIAEFINVLSQLITPNVVSNHMIPLIMQYPFLISFFVIAITPAVCEELIYRGVLYRNYRKSGLAVGVLLSGFLFGIMHMNLNQFSYAFVLGILLALVNEITGSVLPSVFLHLYINGRSVVMVQVVIRYLSGLRERYVAAEAAGDAGLMESLRQMAEGVPIESGDWLERYINMENGAIGATMLLLLPGFLTAVAGVIVIFKLLFKLRKKKEETGTISVEIPEENKEKGVWRTVASPELFIGIVFCIVFMLFR